MAETQLTLADYLAALRRRRWLILVAVAITTGFAVLFASRQVREYRAAATSLLNPDASLVQTAAGAAADAQARFDAGQALIAHTPTVAVKALALAGHPQGITPGQLVAMTTVSSDPNSNILTFAVTTRNRALAVQLVNAYVDSFSTYSADQLTGNIQAAIANETRQITSLSRQIAEKRKAGLSSGSLYPELHGLLQQRTAEQQTLSALSASGGAEVAQHAQGASLTQPNVKKDVGLGLLLGLVLGLALAFLREALDTRTRDVDEIAETLALPLLARLPTPSRSRKATHELVMLDDDHGDAGEPYRKLAVAFDFANLELRAKTILVTSAVEKEGKSTTVANLAVAFARAGRRVTLVDLDLRRPILERFFGITGQAGVTDVVLRHADLDEAHSPIAVTHRAVEPSSGNGNGAVRMEGVLHVLPAGTVPPDPSEFLATSALKDLLARLAERSDVVLIDSAPLLPVSDSQRLGKVVDGILVIVKARDTPRPALREMRRVLDQLTAPVLGFILTGAESDPGYGYGAYYGAAHRPGAIPGQQAASRRRVGSSTGGHAVPDEVAVTED